MTNRAALILSIIIVLIIILLRTNMFNKQYTMLRHGDPAAAEYIAFNIPSHLAAATKVAMLTSAQVPLYLDIVRMSDHHTYNVSYSPSLKPHRLIFETSANLNGIEITAYAPGAEVVTTWTLKGERPRYEVLI